jgi:hypothetical protein
MSAIGELELKYLSVFLVLAYMARRSSHVEARINSELVLLTGGMLIADTFSCPLGVRPIRYL